MNDLKLHICSNVSYWMGSWVDGWLWGCLPDELSSTKNPESIFLSTPKKGRQGLAQLGQLIFCLILCVSISFPIIRLSFWFSFEGPIFFLSFFWVLIFRFWFFFLQFSFNLQGRGGRAPGGKTDLWLFASSLPKTGNGYYWHITSGRGKFIPFL